MEYTETSFFEFVKEIINTNENCNLEKEQYNKKINALENKYAEKCNNLSTNLKNKINTVYENIRLVKQEEEKIVDSRFLKIKEELMPTVHKLEESVDMLYLMESIELRLTKLNGYDMERNRKKYTFNYSIDSVLEKRQEFLKLENELEELSTANAAGKKHGNYSEKCSYMYCLLTYSKMLVYNNIGFHDNILSAFDRSEDKDEKEKVNNNFKKFIEASQNQVEEHIKYYLKEKELVLNNKKREKQECLAEYKKNIKLVFDDFLKKFPASELRNLFKDIYSKEPSYSSYSCRKTMPEEICLWESQFNISNINIVQEFKNFLDKNYYFLIKDNKVKFPCYTKFDKSINRQFLYDDSIKETVAKDAKNLAMRLFMQIPPRRVMFTFIDPVSLGASFAMFTRLVDLDDRTSEVINGKIWSSSKDIEDKLKIMTDHISNVTQKCLQDKYENIFEYNRDANQNAEPYHILMIMDFPAGFSERSIKYLEQIINSGPKCGVFTIIYHNSTQSNNSYSKLDSIIKNIEQQIKNYKYSSGLNNIFYKDKNYMLKNFQSPPDFYVDGIISNLKEGIKNAEKITIEIKPNQLIKEKYSSKNGIRIPFGKHGANQNQYLTLGVGGSHHALLVGATGSGKSSLLHTIILTALNMYSPDELSIYLLDFKRGVEFKIYADYILPSFKVIAIESEREFGYSILQAIEREQKVRANLFKKNGVNKIEEYRELGNKMPRVLVIMDEIQELFLASNDNLSKKSSEIIKRIILQGRAFGVHLLLSSQSYSNITGIDRSMIDQMAVRIVLKCSNADADLLLKNGSAEVDQISIDDPGRGIYNSEAGNKEFNSHFRASYIVPEDRPGLLEEISEETAKYYKQPTRILLSNIENNKYCIFNQFTNYNDKKIDEQNQIYVGEPLSMSSDLNLLFGRNPGSNLLVLGENDEKARSIFTFSLLSLCINYYVKHSGTKPNQPFIYLLNSKPLEDPVLVDNIEFISNNLPSYIKYISCGDEVKIKDSLSTLFEQIINKNNTGSTSDIEQYFFVFGYQRSEELKSNYKQVSEDEIDKIFSLINIDSNSDVEYSSREKFYALIKDGSSLGIHTVLWQDSFTALERDDANLMSYFNLRIAFDMKKEDFSRAVSENDTENLSSNDAIYYNKARDNQKFRLYQTSDEEWLYSICCHLENKE